MLKLENFRIDHINMLREESNSDPSILERTIYAFGLLESLTRVKIKASSTKQPFPFFTPNGIPVVWGANAVNLSPKIQSILGIITDYN